MLTTQDFLRKVITAQEGYFCLAIGGPGHGWNEEFFNWPQDIDKIVERANSVKDKTNVYFSTYLFSEPRSLKNYAIPSKTIQADLDNANLDLIPIAPTILIETSPGRHQGYWLLDTTPDIDVLEILSRKITYSIKDCDHSGWPIARKVRLPNTFNYKYLEGPQPVAVKAIGGRVYREADLELLPDVTIVELERYDESFLDAPPPIDLQELNDMGPNELLETVKTKIGAEVYRQYNIVQGDRSKALWGLMCALYRAGLTREQVYFLASRSANNKFIDLRHSGERELAKDVLRAEATVKSNIEDQRAVVNNLRKLPVPINERRYAMYSVILARLKKEGEFIRTDDTNLWYIRTELGRPVLVSPRSDYMKALLDVEFGLNPIESEANYVLYSLMSYCMGLPVTATTGALSYYDSPSNTLLLHTGKKDVMYITKDGISKVIDGAYGIVFPWPITSDAFNPVQPVLENATKFDWAQMLFDKSLHNLVGITEEEAYAILKVWFMFLLFKDATISRPLLALFGQPGSGKSTLFRRIYSLLYGKNRSLGGITKPEDFDQAVASDPLVVLDNVDTWQPWLPDRLALSASTSDIVRRKLYTDSDTVVLKRQALLGITAHNPKFGREDITDRLVLLNFERLQKFIPEGEMISEILAKRNQIWGAIVDDIQAVLRQPMPNPADVPQFRVEDFARVGYWIASALNIAPDFSKGLEALRSGQKSFNLDEDHILVEAIRTYVDKGKFTDQYQPVGKIFNNLSVYAQDQHGFITVYGNAKKLGQKLWALQDSLKEVFAIDWKYDTNVGGKVWIIGKKNGTDT